jgi:hypothetical protein
MGAFPVLDDNELGSINYRMDDGACQTKKAARGLTLAAFLLNIMLK